MDGGPGAGRIGNGEGSLCRGGGGGWGGRGA